VKLPDLVVLDLMLPVKGGLEVCRELRMGHAHPRDPDHHAHRQGRRIRPAHRLREPGADDYVTKPYSTKVLIQRIKKELRRRQGGEEVAGGERLYLPGSCRRTAIVIGRFAITRSSR